MVKLPLKINRKALIVLAAVLVVEILSMIAFAIHQRELLAQLDDEYRTQNDQLVTARKQGDLLKAAQTQLASEKTQLTQLELSLPTRDYLPTLLVQLQKLARDTNNAITSVTPAFQTSTPPPAAGTPGAAGANGAAPAANGAPPAANATPAQPNPPGPGATNPPPAGAAAPGAGGPAAAEAASYDRYNLGLSIDGTYRSVMTFLLHLTSFPKIISVDKFQLHSTAPEEPGQDTNAGASLTCTAYIVKGT